LSEHDGCWIYIVECSNHAFYVGTTRRSPEQRVSEHNIGLHAGFTSARLPVRLVYAEHFQAITDAIAFERRVKGWSRRKKQALIDGDFAALVAASKRRKSFPSTPRSSS
jgi:putative endonuclease